MFLATKEYSLFMFYILFIIYIKATILLKETYLEQTSKKMMDGNANHDCSVTSTILKDLYMFSVFFCNL